MTTNVYNLKNEVVKTIDLSDKIFGVEWKPALVEQVLRAQEANARAPWAHAKGRGEVRGGGRKPRPQKGSGRSRQGSIRSPIWKGGGKSHGPSKDRDYSQKVNKKMKKVAMFSVLSHKLGLHELKIFDALAMQTPKTKDFALQMKGVITLKKGVRKLDVLLIPSLGEKNIFRAARNIPKTKVIGPESVNIYDLLNYRNVFVDEAAIATIEKHYALK